MKLYEELEWRGLIKDVTDDNVRSLLNEDNINFYIGTDPTADSLHIGHYSSFLITKRLANHGHTPILLVGGATALIGDPKGNTERSLLDLDFVSENYKKLKEQIQKIFPFEVVNNLDWVNNVSLITLLRDYGTKININYMLNKDLVKRQLLADGISFTEFTYMLIQGLDFEHLYKNNDVILQVAGSDQWGNITTGVEIVRKNMSKTVYGLTMPLVTDENGIKFGKSEGNAIWLDKNKTSVKELYKFLFRTSDEIIISYLKKLTLLEPSVITEIEEVHFADPTLRIAQQVLSMEIINDIHGYEDYIHLVETEKLNLDEYSKNHLDKVLEHKLNLNEQF